ncbi:serine/threonine protein kinase [Actinoplanes sp. KI2]|uniref:serine/threonine-protein kinase n=1 Tax=Actinoplanes sp. KI2 TaxID=2983315 RepID=UPI0021D58A1B|nr:serine/threonine-protein kinase [Actinoplanes sp. KI2]MCU7728789.1 serine/threonine protein kinase [Actinoplanes sp. KI2]
MTSHVYPVRTGQLIADRYLLVEPLGAGGLGRVWLARDHTDDGLVAIKRCALPEGLAPDAGDLFFAWTVHEARELSRIGHPNVVRIFDVIPDDEPWIVMEYVPSRPLQEVIDESGPLPPVRVAAIGLAMLDGLLAVRRAGLLHLDIKPGNVLIAQDGRAMLTDFGPAVTTEGLRALAAAGIVLGSPKYLAPERLIDGISLPESDLWSVGATLYYAVEGRPPFARPTVDATLLAIAGERPDPPRRAGPLIGVLAGLLRYEPADRLSVDEAGAALSAIVLESVRTPAGGAWPCRPSRSRIGFAVLAAMVSALLAVVTVLTHRPGGA